VEISMLRNKVHISNRKRIEPLDEGLCSLTARRLKPSRSAKS
jgi:hypothetical protein